MKKSAIVVIENDRPFFRGNLPDARHEYVLISSARKRAQGYSDVVHVASAPRQELSCQLKKRLTAYDLLGVYAPFEESQLLAEIVAEALNLPTDGPGAALRLRNKFLLRSALSGRPELHVRHSMVREPQDIHRFLSEIKSKGVIKPLYGMGSLLTTVVDLGEDLTALYTQLTRDANLIRSASVIGSVFERQNPADLGFVGGEEVDPCREFLIEERLVGRELSVEAAVVGGELTILTIHDVPEKSGSCDDTIFLAPAQLSGAEATHSFRLISEALMVLGVKNRVLCIELMLTQHGPRIIEINGRPGGLATVRSVECLTGVNLHSAAAGIAAREPTALSGEGSYASAGFVVLNTHETGKLKRVHGLSEVRRLAPSVEVSIAYETGDFVPAVLRRVPYMGHVFCTGIKRSHVEQTLDEARRLIHFEFDPPVEYSSGGTAGGYSG